MPDAIPCKGCQKNLGDHTRQRGFISIFAQGDERILSWWLCDACGVYTRREYVDRFHGEPDVYLYGPFPKDVGDADLARVATCPASDDKWCTCETHRHFESH